MSLFEYTTEQQLTLVKSVSMLDKVYQYGNTLYWKQGYFLEGPDSYISVGLDWMHVQFNQPLPEGAIEYGFSVSHNLMAMVVNYIAEGQGWLRYPVDAGDIKNIVTSLIDKVDLLSKESPDIIIEDLELESLSNDYQYWPKEAALQKVTSKIKAKLIKAIQLKVEEAIKDIEI